MHRRNIEIYLDPPRMKNFESECLILNRGSCCVLWGFVRYFAILSKGRGDGVSVGKWRVQCV